MKSAALITQCKICEINNKLNSNPSKPVFLFVSYATCDTILGVNVYITPGNMFPVFLFMLHKFQREGRISIKKRMVNMDGEMFFLCVYLGLNQPRG